MTETVQLTLCILDDGGSDSRHLAPVSRELVAVLGRQSGISARLQDDVAEPGSRGALQEFGTVLMQIAGGGGALVSLVSVLKTFVARRATLEFELQRPDGAKLKFKAENLGSQSMNELESRISAFLNQQPCRNNAMPS